MKKKYMITLCEFLTKKKKKFTCYAYQISQRFLHSQLENFFFSFLEYNYKYSADKLSSKTFPSYKREHK